MQLLSALIVSPGCFTFRRVIAEVILLALVIHSGSPLFAAVFPEDSLVLAASFNVLAPVAAILRQSAYTEIFPTIIITVTIDVVNYHVPRRLHYEAVDKNWLAANICRCAAPTDFPLLIGNPFIIIVTY